MDNNLIRAQLKQRFPWLGTNKDVSGADVMDVLCQWYSEVGGEEDLESEPELDENDGFNSGPQN